ncbi:glutamine synthetase family protein [Streptomyces sp. NPDC048484]|uniref:glutamine synthetase family protein n=1 Tax=Streptomyces sp. NPDC048484 TaxID=3155146 RepID=UPI003416BB06
MSEETMTPPPRLTPPALSKLVQDGEIHSVLVGVPDMRGALKGKIVNAAHFLAQQGFGLEMCKYVLATDVDMNPQRGYPLTGWHEGFSDLRVTPDMSTLRRLSYLPGTVLALGDAFHPDGRPVEVAPRQILSDQLQQLADLGLTAKVGVESEFMLYQGTPAQARRSGYRELTPVSPYNLDYALDHPPVLSAFFNDLQRAMTVADCPVEAIKTEGAAGQVEVTWPYGDPVRACDTYAFHKHAVRPLAEQHGLAPTFMAAPQTGVGSGMHLHVSLWRDEQPVFAARRHGELSELMQHSIAGLLCGLPFMAPLYAPTRNSYRRFTPHSFAPTSFLWGRDNRSCAIRVAGHHANTHLESRLAGADANPYLALAATIASIIYGIRNKPKLPSPCTGDAYETLAPHRRIPSSLDEALTPFVDSPIVRAAFGSDVAGHYLHAGEIECAAAADEVTDVELRRGFDRA